MASAQPSELATSEAGSDIRRRALRRLVIAVILLAAAFGALLTYERFSAPSTVAPGARPAQTPPPQSGGVAARLPVLPAPASAPAEPEAEPAPPAALQPKEADAATAKLPPPPPQVINNERTAAAPPPPPPAKAATARSELPAQKAATTVPAPAAVPAPAPTTKGVPAAAPMAQPPAQNALPQPPAAQATAAAPAKADPPRGYVVQLGVFASPQNAEALQRKLAEAGVTTTTETRVLIGPFRDRADAERSLEVVKKLGLGAVVMPSR